MAILDGVRKTCRGLGITIHHEPVPVSDHQNQACDRFEAELAFSLSNSRKLVQVARRSFHVHIPCMDGLFCTQRGFITTSLLLLVPLPMKGAQIDFTLASWRCLVNQFFGFLKTDRKAAARWQRGIWLGKSLVNDVHIIAQGEHSKEAQTF